MSKLGKPRTTKGLAALCARLAEDKLANDTVIMDLGKIGTAPCEFFVICSCDSEVQAIAVLENIVKTTKSLGIDRPRIEGEQNRDWILVDFFDVVVHIMKKEIRHFYRLEKLWGDASFLKLSNTNRPIAMKEDEILPLVKETILD